MKYFSQYIRPESTDALLQAISEHPDFCYLAGGTDLLVELRSGAVHCDGVIDLSHLPDLKEIRETPEKITIGSMVRMKEMEESACIQTRCRALAAASSQVGSPLVRNRGTLGGNVVNCAAAGDTIPVLLALHAEALVLSPDGRERSLPVQELLAGNRRSALAPGELILSFSLPVDHRSSAFVKFGYRKAVAISNLSMAMAAQVNEGHMNHVSLVVGAVGPTAYALPEIAELLEGCALKDEAAIDTVASRCGDLVYEKLGGREEAPFKASYKRHLASAGIKYVATQLNKECCK